MPGAGDGTGTPRASRSPGSRRPPGREAAPDCWDGWTSLPVGEVDDCEAIGRAGNKKPAALAAGSLTQFHRSDFPNTRTRPRAHSSLWITACLADVHSRGD